MDWKLEVVPIPVSDVDRAKRFYSEQVGFAVDLDTHIGEGMRLVQLTPPGSGCSIHLSAGILNVAPGVLEGLLLVVSDIEAARAELAERAWRLARLYTGQMARGWRDGAGAGTRSSFSAIRMATDGSCRSVLPQSSRVRHRSNHSGPRLC